jgi:RNA polymerase sigma factor (sigma-70 family)
MTNAPLRSALQHLQRILAPPANAELTDCQLLQRFARQRDEAAFALLVKRHGALVLGVCRRVLQQSEDAEDAFQATFLVLARKAASAGWQDSVGNWLYEVAYRLACKMKCAAVRRQTREALMPNPPEPIPPPMPTHDLCPLVDEELQCLPAKYRGALLLCYAEGRTRDQAAQELGWSRRTLQRRLEQGLDLLRRRLVQRGVTLTAALLVAALSQSSAEAALDVLLLAGTVQAAVGFVSGTQAAGVSTKAAVLAQEVLRNMALTKVKIVTLLVLAVCVLAGGAGLLAHRVLAAKHQDEPNLAAAGPEEAKPEPADAALVDAHGDALPAGAVARMGTVRFRSPHTITMLRFSADGTALIGSGWDNSVQVWDRASGRKLHHLVLQNEWRSSLTASGDGKRIAAGGRDQDRKIRVWDTATGKLLFQSEPLESFVFSLSFSPDGKVLASTSGTQLRLWDIATFHVVAQMTGPDDRLSPIGFSPDGATLAMACKDHSIRLLDVNTKTEVHALRGHQDNIYALSFSADGKMLASGGGDKDRTVRTWDVATGEELRRLSGPAGWVRPVVFAPDGKTIATAGQDGKIRLWDAATGQERRQISVAGHDDNVGPWVMALTFAPDGKTLASSGTEHQVHLWDAQTGKEVSALAGHADSVNSVVYAPDGKTLLTASGDKTVRRWDLAGGKEIRTFGAREGGFSCARVSPDGKLVAAVGPNHVISVWEADTGKELHRLTGHTGEISAITFAPDGKRLVSAGNRDEGTIRVWDVASGKEMRQLPGSKLEVTAVAFSPDGKLLAAGMSYENIALFDFEAGREVRRLRWQKGYAHSLVFSPDGKLLVSAGGLGNAVHLWDVDSGTEVRQIAGLPRIVNAVALAPDGRWLAAAGQDNVVRLWEVSTGKEAGAFTGHQGQGYLGGINALSFAPDGRTIASAGDDTQVLVWDVTGRLRDGRLQEERLRPDQLESDWADLAGEDARRARVAMWELAASPQALPLLKERLRPVMAAEPERTARLLRDLDAAAFEVRQRATVELEKLGESARPALEKALTAAPAEARRRIEALLEKLNAQPAAPETLRALRALAVLEQNGTPEARQQLEVLANGLPEARVSREAKTSLRRLFH